MKHVCVDLDGVLVEYHGWKGANHFGAEIPGARRALGFLRDAGFRVLIHTARASDELSTSLIWDWVDRSKLDELVAGVTNVKPKTAVQFFDDRATAVLTNRPRSLEMRTWAWLRRLDTAPDHEELDAHG